MDFFVLLLMFWIPSLATASQGNLSVYFELPPGFISLATYNKVSQVLIKGTV